MSLSESVETTENLAEARNAPVQVECREIVLCTAALDHTLYDDAAGLLPVEMPQVVFPKQRRRDMVFALVLFVSVEENHNGKEITNTNVRILFRICNFRATIST